ncbi:MAG: UDP-N-acetylglucosamine 1-carboxyvinyltransferase [Planctomycetota bacterium]|nr:UDP-N-acetylglucosamine 1-carboxyvinyltransferase [Planctomycetota bacterium]MDI6787661.1 UDP-N-acetylglucosamine 1-carboxyvinyltransferase [Planctomycetota bacterium]
MDKFVIRSGNPLSGTVSISGSKNASLPILAATILSAGKCILKGIPALRDVDTLLQILKELGLKIERKENGDIWSEVSDERNSVARYELVKTMRASICILGPLLAKRKYAKVSLPGGCVIGVRPIDLHEKGLKLLGADISYKHGYLVANVKQLVGTDMYLGGTFGSTVTGTANILMASCLAKGRTVIENAACEPEVQDLALFLTKMGAKIKGIGTHRLEIEGVKKLTGATYTVIPDRIEAGTFIVAGALAGKNVTIKNCRLDHLSAIIDNLRQMGTEIEKISNTECRVRQAKHKRPIDITTLPYPGFPTDMQAQMMVLLALADGISIITERIYPDRFMHVAELNRMGARIRKEGATAVIEGRSKLWGAPVMASDLRASAALVLAGLVADGSTEIQRVYHIDRGYEQIEKKLQKLGANIKRVFDKMPTTADE